MAVCLSFRASFSYPKENHRYEGCNSKFEFIYSHLSGASIDDLSRIIRQQFVETFHSKDLGGVWGIHEFGGPDQVFELFHRKLTAEITKNLEVFRWHKDKGCYFDKAFLQNLALK